MDEEALQLLREIRALLSGLVDELDRYRGLLPEPGTLKARLLGRKTASAVDQWNGGR